MFGLGLGFDTLPYLNPNAAPPAPARAPAGASAPILVARLGPGRSGVLVHRPPPGPPLRLRRCAARLMLIHDRVVQPARVQSHAGAGRDAPRAAAALARAGARAPVLHQLLRGGVGFRVQHRSVRCRCTCNAQRTSGVRYNISHAAKHTSAQPCQSCRQQRRRRAAAPPAAHGEPNVQRAGGAAAHSAPACGSAAHSASPCAARSRAPRRHRRL